MDLEKYFDYAAATPLSDTAQKAMQPYLGDKFYNPSSNYLAAIEVKKAVNQARADIADLLGARPSEVIFTAGGTESCNLAISGIMNKHTDGELIVSSIEHAAVAETADYWEQSGRKVVRTTVDQRGQLDMKKPEASISSQTVLISIIHSHNEIGVIQNLNKIAEVIAKVRANRKTTGNELPLYLHTDACQSANYLDLHIKRLGVDLMTINSAKVSGPKQVGALFVRAGIELSPIIHGGGQERGWRGGTENPAGVIGFAAALTKAQKVRRQATEHARQLRDEFLAELEKQQLDYQLNSSLKNSLPSIVSLSFAGLDGEQLVMALDQEGFAVATGAACSEDTGGPSESLLAIGLDKETASGTLRISFGPANTPQSVVALAQAIKNAVGLVTELQPQA